MAFNFPSSPTVGQVFEDYVWDGQKWIKVAPGDVVTSATPPSNPKSGDLWWDSDTGVLYIWYNDGTSAQWVGADSSGSLGEAPVNTTVYGRKDAGWVRAVAVAGDVMTGALSLPALTVAGGAGIGGALFVGANLTLAPSVSATPANNGQLTFEATSNTSLKLKYKGSDGVVRSVTLTLA